MRFLRYSAATSKLFEILNPKSPDEVPNFIDPISLGGSLDDVSEVA